MLVCEHASKPALAERAQAAAIRPQGLLASDRNYTGAAAANRGPCTVGYEEVQLPAQHKTKWQAVALMGAPVTEAAG